MTHATNSDTFFHYFCFVFMNIFNGFYSIIIILVALYSVVKGFKTGISQQMATLLGFGFGAVAARVLSPQLSIHFLWAADLSLAPEFNEFTVDLVCSISIFATVFCLFSLLSPILQKLMRVIEVGIINRICGAVFSLVKYLLWTSMALNLLLCFSEQSGLLYYERSNDGNLVGSVMDITAVFLGCYSAEDFALFHQLKDAKSISHNRFRNLNTPINVIFAKDISPQLYAYAISR